MFLIAHITSPRNRCSYKRKLLKESPERKSRFDTAEVIANAVAIREHRRVVLRCDKVRTVFSGPKTRPTYRTLTALTSSIMVLHPPIKWSLRDHTKYDVRLAPFDSGKVQREAIVILQPESTIRSEAVETFHHMWTLETTHPHACLGKQVASCKDLTLFRLHFGTYMKYDPSGCGQNICSINILLSQSRICLTYGLGPRR